MTKDIHERPPVIERLSQFYEPEEIETWMMSPHPQLGGISANEALARGGFDEVHAIIDRLDSGVHL
ncbi:MAG: antitoxin Xre/MbcA/ParS toxin-binding domain-containing protein [Pseudomonadota bacterium]